ncbi:hypothetical protein D3C81_1886860 [compost metagenome]
MLGLLLYSKTASPQKPPLFTAVSAATKLPPPALSAQFLEPRIRVYRDYRDHLYPGMQPIDYLGFVYAK